MTNDQDPDAEKCWYCGNPGITYAMFSGGDEYYCPTCDDRFPYREGQRPPRVQLIKDREFDALRGQMREHLTALADEIEPVKTRPNPTALGILQSLGFVVAPRERACLAVEPVTGTECARTADHAPYPHAGMWQGADPDSWTVTAWPILD